MNKDQVIKMRDTLKAGNNWPLMVYIDNTFRIIDESNTLQFTKWDDENGILYNYSLTNPIMEESPSNIGGGISVFATDYEYIQSMEMARLDLNDLKISLEAIGCVSPEWQERIFDRFKSILNPNIVNLYSSDINKAMGVVDGNKALNDNDDYYNGRFTQSFTETRLMADHNAYVEKKIAEEKAAKEESTGE